MEPTTTLKLSEQAMTGLEGENQLKQASLYLSAAAWPPTAAGISTTLLGNDQYPNATLLQDLAFHAQQDLLAVGLVDGSLLVFDCTGPAPTQKLSFAAHTLSCRAVTFASKGAVLLSASADKSLLVYDVAKAKTIGRIPDAHLADVTRLCRIDENTAATGDEAGGIKTWDLRQKKALQHLTHHKDYVSDLAAHPRHPCLLATSADGSLSVMDFRKQQVRDQSDGDPDDGLESLAVIKGGHKVVCGSMSGIVNVFDWGQFSNPSGQFPGHPSSVDSMVKLDEDTVLTGGGDGVLRALSVLPNKFLGIVGEDSEGGCDRLAISANSKLLASTSYCSAVRLWNLDEEDDSEQNGSQGDRHTDKDSSSEDEQQPQKRRSKKKRKKSKPADSRTDFFKDLL